MKLCFVKASNTIYDVLFPYGNNTGLSSQRVLPINHYKAACLPPHVQSSHRRPFLSCLSLCCLRLQHSVACLFIVPVLPLECRLSEVSCLVHGFISEARTALAHKSSQNVWRMNEWTASNTHQSLVILLSLNTCFLFLWTVFHVCHLVHSSV